MLVLILDVVQILFLAPETADAAWSAPESGILTRMLPWTFDAPIGRCGVEASSSWRGSQD